MNYKIIAVAETDHSQILAQAHERQRPPLAWLFANGGRLVRALDSTTGNYLMQAPKRVPELHEARLCFHFRQGMYVLNLDEFGLKSVRFEDAVPDAIRDELLEELHQALSVHGLSGCPASELPFDYRRMLGLC